MASKTAIGVVSHTVRKFEAVRFDFSTGLAVKVDPSGTINFLFKDSTVEVTSVLDHVAKVGHMDKIFLTAESNAYDPVAEMKVAMSRGFSEIAAFAMAFLRAMLVIKYKLIAASQAVKKIDELVGSIVVSAETAERIITSAEFWYSAPAWMARYAAERAATGFEKTKSSGEVLLPWLMKLYAQDAHVAVVVSNFIDADLFAPFKKDQLTVIFARGLFATEKYCLPKIYMEKVTPTLNKTLHDVALAYGLLEAVLHKTPVLKMVPEALVVYRQVLFVYEVLISQVFEKSPTFSNPEVIIEQEALPFLDDVHISLATMLVISEEYGAQAFAQGVEKNFGIKVTKEMKKSYRASFRTAKKGQTFSEVELTLGRLTNLVRISIA